ncbi:MAG: precorrin-2 C(20)-methyltransferase, partial [Herbaspirillum sp.]|nr:precorrin-2 C(20)-methyltransferase [Herbaspirillum sp.]
AQHCGFARRIGLEGEVLATDLTALDAAEASGYLAVLLIRKTAQAQRHRAPEENSKGNA